MATARDGISFKAALAYLNADRLQTNLPHRHGFITPTIGAVHKKAGALNEHVFREENLRFNARYVSLAALAEWRGVHPRKLFVGLRSVGVHPALPKDEFHARFYPREIAEEAAWRLEFDQ